MLKVAEIFESVQFEGPFCGTPAIFVRFAGCTRGCSFCDTDHSTREYLTPQQIAKRVNSLAKKDITLVIITGGEPLQQDIRGVLTILRKKYFIQIETSGQLLSAVYKHYYWGAGIKFVISPKSELPITAWLRGDCFKLLVGEGIPFPLQLCIQKGSRETEFFFQPADQDDRGPIYKINLEKALEKVKYFNEKFKKWYPPARVSIQTHKYLGLA